MHSSGFFPAPSSAGCPAKAVQMRFLLPPETLRISGAVEVRLTFVEYQQEMQ